MAASERNRIEGCVIEQAEVGQGCELINCVIRGRGPGPDDRVIIGDRVRLYGCTVVCDRSRRAFAVLDRRVESVQTVIESDVELVQSTVINSRIGRGVRGAHAYVEHSEIGPRTDLRRFSNITLSRTAAGSLLGSELSKTLIEGSGFVSEHGASYLSLLAPAEYPIIDENGRERVLELPNVTNIGAGTVFANYGGRMLSFGSEPVYEKGTAIVWSAFTCINARIVNRYGRLEGAPDWFALLRRRDLTLLGPFCFVENKVTGRIPAFAYAGGPRPANVALGWVLERKPGVVLTAMELMRQALGDQAGRMAPLIEGTIRLELQLLREALADPTRRGYTRGQLESGIRVLESNLDGRWRMDDSGRWLRDWRLVEGVWRPL
jgi:hypothetical protein